MVQETKGRHLIWQNESVILGKLIKDNIFIL